MTLNTHENLRRRPRAMLAWTLLVSAALLTGCGSDPDEMVASAKQFAGSGDKAAAVIQLKNALQSNPEHAEARLLLGQLTLASADYATAAKELARARKAGVPDQKVVPDLALAMLKSGEAAALVEQFAKVSLGSPEADGKLAALVGDALTQLGRGDEARRAYERAVGLDPRSPRARLGLARLQASGKDLAGAKAAVGAVLADSGESAEARELLAGIAAAEGQDDVAVTELKKAVDADPTQPTNHFRLISLLLQTGQVGEAKDALARMKKETGGRQVYALYLQAYIDFIEKNEEAAAAGIAKVLAAVPDFLPGRLLAGAIHLRRQDYNQALQQLGVVLSSDSGNALARRLAASAHLMARNPDKALETIEPLLEKAPDDASLQLLAGQAHLAKGDFEASSEFFARAVSQRPEDAAARVRLGVSRLGEGDSGKAFLDLEAASKLDPTGVQADVALAMARLRQGKADEAIKAVERIEAKQPSNPLGPNLRGGALLAKGKFAEARAAFEAASKLDPMYLPAVVNLARIDLAERREQDARNRLAALLEKRPQDANAHLALADVIAKSGGSAEELEAALRAGVKGSPDSISLQLALIRVLTSKGDAKGALAVAQQAQTQAPEDPRLLSVLGASQLAAGQAELAVSTYGRLVAAQPGTPRPLILLAGAQNAAGSTVNAEQTLRKAVRQFDDSILPTQALVAFLLQQRDFRKAGEASQAWLARQPKSAEGHLLAADVAVRQSDWKTAIAELRTAQQLAPAAKTAVALHAALTASGDPKGAEKTMGDWLKSQPEDLVVRGYLAEIALREKDYPGALKIYKAMSEVAPKNALILNNLAWVAKQLKDPRADAYGQRALDVAPDNAAVLDTVGMIRSADGKHAEALVLMEKAAAGAPKSIPIALNLARAYAAAGKSDKAAGVLDRLLKDNPDSEPLKQEIERVRAAF